MGTKSGSKKGASTSTSKVKEEEMPRKKSPQPWRRSESPVEDWGDVSENEWGFDIVGEEVDYWGDVRYEVEWDDWKRKDATNNTWKYEYIESNGDSARKRWDKEQARRRRNLAEEDDSPIELHPGLDIHNNNTRLRAQAAREKLKLSEKQPVDWLKELRETRERKHASADLEDPTPDGEEGAPRRLRSRSKPRHSSTASASQRGSSTTLAGTPSVTGRAQSSRFVTPASSIATLPTASPSSYVGISQEIPMYDGFPTGLSEKARGKQRAMETDVPPLPFRSPTKAYYRTQEVLSRRAQLSAEWSRFGAPITFSNEIDDEEVPPLPPNFRYIEKGYEYDSDVELPEGLEEFLLSCSGHRKCMLSDIDGCECQEAARLDDETVEAAYDTQGYYLFGYQGREVLECTPRCECGESCPNRVLQRRRDVPLEIFKTEHCGWGVRAKTRIKKGKVLGMYTGLLIRSDKVPSLPSREYTFDLDGDARYLDSDNESNVSGYTVDCSNMGNWSRFINHSCDPNLTVFEVVYDQLPGNGMAYHAYAANRDIHAGEELVFNYNPAAADIRKKKKQQKYRKTANGRRVPADATECFCGAEGCRGFI